ncbi:MAG: hypothetical protein AB7L71_20115 [Vicinamibacterales bacterium]
MRLRHSAEQGMEVIGPWSICPPTTVAAVAVVASLLATRQSLVIDPIAALREG